MNPEKITVAPFLPWMNKFAARNPLQGLTPDQAAKARTSYAAREAAKLSTGPRTDQGKAISSKNARKHGFSGAQMVIDDEDQAAYDAHLDAYHQTLEPTNQVEADTVRLAANAMWRIDRLTSIETGLLELEMGIMSIMARPHITLISVMVLPSYAFSSFSSLYAAPLHTNNPGARVAQPVRWVWWDNLKFSAVQTADRSSLRANTTRICSATARPGKIPMLSPATGNEPFHRTLDAFPICYSRFVGGPKKALHNRFSRLRPNAQGKLVLNFVPVVTQAILRSIELSPERP